LINHTLLLDSKTGDTWVLNDDPDEEKSLSWIKVPRLLQKPKAEPAELGPDAKPKPRKEVDPFG
jgi:hypothetical protein